MTHECEICGATIPTDRTCIELFHELCRWEFDYNLYDLHHLMVLSYFLQHPNLYSPFALEKAKTILSRFLDDKASPAEIRKELNRYTSIAGTDYKIAGTDTCYGQYRLTISWTMSVSDVIDEGHEAYYTSVEKWVEAIYQDLQKSGNLT